jgi:tellurium resistance protein TerZ
MPASPEKHKTAPLNVTQQAQRRIFVGLGWDPNTKAGLGDVIGAMIGGKKTYHDLDLMCFVYDAGKQFIAKIDAKSREDIDHIGRIYHSGDNTEGLGEGDDEQISVELKNLPAAIHHIVFVVAIRSGHRFGELQSPEIRLGDGYSDHNFLHHALSAPEGAAHTAFIFATIARDSGAETGWSLKNISLYTDEPQGGRWEDALIAYL